MDNGFIGEVRLMALTFTPDYWFPCDGSQYNVQQYAALYAIIGNTFGGTQGVNFKVPDLRGTTVAGVGADPADPFHPAWGQKGGVNSVGITTANVPSHTHGLTATVAKTTGKTASAAGNWISDPVAGGKSPYGFIPATGSPAQEALNAGSLSAYAGGTQTHENRQPYLAMQYMICWQGEFPIRP
jgi:microcystin-dependent protein